MSKWGSIVIKMWFEALPGGIGGRSEDGHDWLDYTQSHYSTADVGVRARTLQEMEEDTCYLASYTAKTNTFIRCCHSMHEVLCILWHFQTWVSVKAMQHQMPSSKKVF